MGTPGGGRAHLHRLSVQEGEGVGTDFDGPEGSRCSTTFGPANVNLGRRLILGRSEEYWRLPRMIRPRYFSAHVKREGEEKRKDAHERVRSALGVVKEWEKSTEECSCDREGMACAARHSAKTTSQATHGVLRQLLSLMTAFSRGPPSPE
jgi:hypothetical protein